VYVRVEGAAHLVHDEAPERYRDAVEGFLRTLGSSECRSHSSTEST
jgi:hypothetical protein